MKNIAKNLIEIRLIAVITAVSLIFGLFEYYLVADYQENEKVYNQETITRYQEEYNTIIYGYRIIAKTFFDEGVDKDMVTEILKEANETSEMRRVRLRKSLEEISDDTYRNLVDDDFRQFHFVLKDGTSFLRMHSPQKYGDNLMDVRDTVRIVNETRKYMEGFEEGRIYNGYRFEYPLFDSGEYVGCVETSISFLTIIKLMDRLFENPAFFIIKKSVVADKVWDSQVHKNYIQSNSSPGYYCDKEGYDYISNKGKYNKLIECMQSNEKALKQIRENIEKEETFIFNTSEDNRTYSLVFLKIQNVVGDQVGFLVFFNENNVFEGLKESFIVKSIFVFLSWVLIVAIIMIFHRAKSRIEKITYFDKLTGIYNRNRLYEHILEEMARKKKDGICFSIIMYDLDFFKSINDNHGHMTGDQVLKEVTDLVKETIRGKDHFFRFGGDEFIILLPETELEVADSLAHEVRNAIETGENFAGFLDKITLSMGVVEYREGETADEIICRADKMLYKAKESGRNRVAGKAPEF